MMKFKNILLTLTVIFLLIGLFIYIEPSITGFVVQDKFLISDIKVSAEQFDQEVKVEQFDEHEIKFKDALYYFTLGVEKEAEFDYILIEFMVDSAQIKDKDVDLYFYDNLWQELEIELVKQEGRYNYYKAEAKKFGLFVVSLKEKVEIAAPLVSKDEILLFGLLPIFVIILLFSVLSYGFVRLTQKISYRFYLLLKKGFIGLVKFGLSFGIVVLILDLISIDKQGSVSGMSLIYYAVIPLIVLSLLSNAVLNLILLLHRLVLGNRVYRSVRNSFLLFVSCFVLVFSLLFKFVPKGVGSLSGNEILLFGLLPIILITSFVVFVFYLFYVLTRKVLVRHE